MGNLQRMQKVLERVHATVKNGYKVIVVLSAMAGETNRLVSLAKECSQCQASLELDMLLNTGEQQSVSLFSMLAKNAGLKARPLLGYQIPILTESDFGQARIISIDSGFLRELLKSNDILVVAGFQGVDSEGRLTTLGRGGSDTTGVALAAALGADCEIYTDVDGVYTTDPNICPSARKIDRISYEEMLELSSMGAKVLQIRSVEFARKYNVTVHVRSSFAEDPDAVGTIVTKEDLQMEDVLVSGVAYDKNQCRVTVYNVRDEPGVARTIFKPLSAAGIAVDLIVQNTARGGLTDLTFSIARDDLEKTLNILNDIKEELESEVQYDLNVAKISLVGLGMRNHVGVAAQMFDVLAGEGINILMISTSEIKITCLIDEKYTELAVRSLHEAFDLHLPRE